MNILIVYRGNYPALTAGSKRLSNYIKALQIEKHNPVVLPIQFKSRFRLFDIVTSYFIPLLAFIKVIRMASCYSVVFVYGPGWIFKLSTMTASKIRGKRVATELNEKPYSIEGGSRRDILRDLFKPFHKVCLTKIVFPKFDGFIVISEPLARYTRFYGKDKAIICKVPILVDFELYQKKVGKPDCHLSYIVNTASLNDHKDGIINVFKALTRVINRGFDLHFYLTSRVSPKELLIEIDTIISENKLEGRVTFLDGLDEETLLSYQAHCSMLVLNKVETEQNRYNFATKLGEFLALGKPVITTAIGEVKHYLKDNISCLYVDPSNEIEISDAIIRLLKDESLSGKIGDNGKIIAEKHFDVKSQSKRISDFFTRLIY